MVEECMESIQMKYQKGDHVKIEVTDEKSGDSEWMWLLVSSSDDQQQLVFGQLDSEPVVATGLKMRDSLRLTSSSVDPTHLKACVILSRALDKRHATPRLDPRRADCCI